MVLGKNVKKKTKAETELPEEMIREEILTRLPIKSVGLVCLRRGKKLSLWNPAIHQSREFTLPPRRCADLRRIGLGLHHASNDFKVVVCYLSDELWYASVYSADSDSWRDIYIPDNVFPNSKRESLHAPKTFVKDCPYWTCKIYSANNVFVVSLTVVKFDVESDDFKLLPEFYVDASYQSGPPGTGYELVNMKDCLTLMVYERSKISTLDVYSLDEEGCCIWSKMYSLGPLNLMNFPQLSQGFRYGGEIVYHRCGKFSCYDHRTDTVNRLFGSTAHMNLVSCFTHMPSLVYLRGMKSVHVQTQTRISGNNFKTPRQLINSLRD